MRRSGTTLAAELAPQLPRRQFAFVARYDCNPSEWFDAFRSHMEESGADLFLCWSVSFAKGAAGLRNPVLRMLSGFAASPGAQTLQFLRIGNQAMAKKRAAQSSYAAQSIVIDNRTILSGERTRDVDLERAKRGCTGRRSQVPCTLRLDDIEIIRFTWLQLARSGSSGRNRPNQILTLARNIAGSVHRKRRIRSKLTGAFSN